MRKHIFIILSALCLVGCGQDKIKINVNNINKSSDSVSVKDTFVKEEPKTPNDFRIDTIAFKHKLEDYDALCLYSIPKLVSSNQEDYETANNINKTIWYEISYKEGCDLNEFSDFCRSAQFSYKFEEHYLLVDLSYICFGVKGPVENDNVFLFDLNTGDQLNSYGSHHIVSFAALFTLEGYFDFLNSRGWGDKVKKSVIKAYEEYIKVAHVENYDATINEAHIVARDAQFHIDYNITDKGMFSYWRENNYNSAFSGAARCFEPFLQDKCQIKDIVPYLSEAGKAVIQKDFSIVAQVEGLKSVEKNLFLEYMYEISTNVSEDDNTEEIRSYSLPCQIAVNYSDPNALTGFLYMDGKKERIVGSMVAGMLNLRSKQSDWEASISYSEFYDYSMVPF